LKTGLIGVICAWALNAKFAPEVNGVYTSPSEYIDDEDRISTRLKKIMYPLIERFTLGSADGIKVQYPSQLLPFKAVIKTRVVRCFHNYVDIDKFLSYQGGHENKEILFVGFPFYRKGVDILIAAFKLIAADYPEWKLKILGWYPNPTILNKAINGHPQIAYHPPVHPDEMVVHMCSCAIFVMPSRSEAKARTLVEAMAAGKARIGSNVDGTPTIIADGTDGVLFQSENSVDLANKMRLLIDNPEMRKRLGEAGRVRVQQEFNKEKYYTDLTNFYFEVIGQD
jgi:glycosyltransferase involved in cell wall biosynthesis